MLAAISAQLLAEGRDTRYAKSIPVVLGAAKRVPVTAATDDALRVIALALVRAGALVEAQAFAERYLRSCDALHRPAMPLMWPLRTAGAGLRIGLLVTEDQLPVAESIAAAVRHELGVHYRFTAFVDRVAGDALPLSPTLEIRVLPADVDSAARGIAVLDLDVLLDVAGLRAAGGPLLARQPARERWALSVDAMPSAPQFYDRTFDATVDEPVATLVNAFRNAQAAVACRAVCEISAADLAVLWDDAVLAHQRSDTTAARVGYANVLGAQPDSVAALYLSALIARADGDTDFAREGFRATVRRATLGRRVGVRNDCAADRRRDVREGRCLGGRGRPLRRCSGAHWARRS
jgi:hypothetical protein